MPETETETPTKSRQSPKRVDAHCSIDGCKRPYRAKTYCVTHYKAWRRGEMEGHTARYKICTKEGCKKPRAKGSLCEAHAKGGEA